MFTKNKKGFTLIELLTVIAILGILVLLAAPKLLGYTEQAKMAHIKNDVKAYENVIEVKLTENSQFTANWDLINKSEIDSLKNSGSLYDRTGVVKESYSLMGGVYKKIPKDKTLLNTKLSGEFYLNPNGKVYYYKGSIASNFIQIPNEEGDFYYFIDEGKVFLTGYKGSRVDVVIPETIEDLPVYSIFHGAFLLPYDLLGTFGNVSGKELESIHVPSSVRKVESSAFSELNLTRITFDEGVQEFGYGVFENTTVEEKIILPQSFEKTDMATFSKSTLINGVDLGGLQKIENRDFEEATVKSTLVIPSSVKVIADYSFSRSKLNSIVFEEGLEIIGEWSFSSETNPLEIHLPNSLKTIGNYAFYEQPVTELTFGNSLETIGIHAFGDEKNTFEKLVIPSSVREIGAHSFVGKFNPELRESLGSLKELTLLGGGIINEHAFAQQSIEKLEIGSNVETIKEFAFYENNLKEVSIPGTVLLTETMIFGENPIKKVEIGAKTIGSGTLSLLDDLEEIVILDTVERIELTYMTDRLGPKVKTIKFGENSNIQFVQDNALSNKKDYNLNPVESGKIIGPFSKKNIIFNNNQENMIWEDL